MQLPLAPRLFAWPRSLIGFGNSDSGVATINDAVIQHRFPKPDTPSLQNFKFSSMSDGSIYVEEIVDKFNGLKVSEMSDGSFYVELIPPENF
jgi:hypothetical protein